MPGLLRGIARTSVVAGTAAAVSNRVSRRQYNRWGAQDAQQGYQQSEAPSQYDPPAPATAPVSDHISQLQGLAELKAQGVVTDAEFAAEKARILAQ
jgi:Short C-terminal domain